MQKLKFYKIKSINEKLQNKNSINKFKTELSSLIKNVISLFFKYSL